MKLPQQPRLLELLALIFVTTMLGNVVLDDLDCKELIVVLSN